MKSGSKYYPLYAYLQQCATDATLAPPSGHLPTQTPTRTTEKNAPPNALDIVLTFRDIETILQKPLPISAQKRAWWSNRDSASALQAGAWIQAGYQISHVDFQQQKVTFSPFTAGYQVERVDDEIVWNSAAVKALRKHMGLTQAKFAQEMGVRRQTVSEWENGVYAPDRSTAKHLALIAAQKSFEQASSASAASE